jgi:hypothetical protein
MGCHVGCACHTNPLPLQPCICCCSTTLCIQSCLQLLQQCLLPQLTQAAGLLLLLLLLLLLQGFIMKLLQLHVLCLSAVPELLLALPILLLLQVNSHCLRQLLQCRDRQATQQLLQQTAHTVSTGATSARHSSAQATCCCSYSQVLTGR